MRAVLTSTGYLANKNTYRRLFETNQMVVDCLEKGAMQPLTGKGWNSCARVRFLHCKVRTRLQRSQRWNTAEWGVPINQEDMAVTVLAFQYNVLLVIELLKIPLTAQEREDYTHLWRYIGYLMGVLDEYNACTSYARSRAYLESIVMHLIDPDETSRYLANHVINAVTDRPPAWWNHAMHASLARILMGTGGLAQPPHSLTIAAAQVTIWRTSSICPTRPFTRPSTSAYLSFCASCRAYRTRRWSASVSCI